MDDNNTICVQCSENYSSQCPPLSLQEVQKMECEEATNGHPRACLTLLSVWCFPPQHRWKNMKEEMHTPPCARPAQPLVSQLWPWWLLCLINGSQARWREICSWFPKRNVLSVWQRGTGVSFIVRHTHFLIMEYLLIYPGQLSPCNSYNLGSLLLN